MALTEQDIHTALQTVVDPLTGQDFVAAKAIKHLQIQGGAVSFDVVLGYPAKSLWASYQQQLEHVVSQVPGVSSVKVSVSSQVVAHAAQPGVALLPQVKNIIGWHPAKAGWASPPLLQIWRWRWPLKARVSVCSTLTFMAPANR